MRTENLNSWEEFEEKVSISSQKDEGRKSNLEIGNEPSELIYRGQENSQWFLETTLQRLEKKIKCDYTFYEYAKKAIDLSNSIDTYTNSNFDLEFFDIPFESYEEMVSGEPPETIRIRKRIQEYLIYLRHCGFPSPFLDWTKSPYIAAFFAFSEIPDNVEYVAIYSFQEMTNSYKYVNYEGTRIRLIDYPLKTHKRHYLQQVQYTICLKGNKNKEGLGNYEEAIADSKSYDELPDPPKQDRLIKYIIPAKEREKVLRKLDKMNISFVSLFDTEDSYIKTLALREFELRKD